MYCTLVEPSRAQLSIKVCCELCRQKLPGASLRLWGTHSSRYKNCFLTPTVRLYRALGRVGRTTVLLSTPAGGSGRGRGAPSTPAARCRYRAGSPSRARSMAQAWAPTLLPELLNRMARAPAVDGSHDSRDAPTVDAGAAQRAADRAARSLAREAAPRSSSHVLARGTTAPQRHSPASARRHESQLERESILDRLNGESLTKLNGAKGDAGEVVIAPSIRGSPGVFAAIDRSLAPQSRQRAIHRAVDRTDMNQARSRSPRTRQGKLGGTQSAAVREFDSPTLNSIRYTSSREHMLEELRDNSETANVRPVEAKLGVDTDSAAIRASIGIRDAGSDGQNPGASVAEGLPPYSTHSPRSKHTVARIPTQPGTYRRRPGAADEHPRGAEASVLSWNEFLDLTERRHSPDRSKRPELSVSASGAPRPRSIVRGHSNEHGHQRVHQR